MCSKIKSKHVTSHLFSAQLLLRGFADDVPSQFLKTTFQGMFLLPIQIPWIALKSPTGMSQFFKITFSMDVSSSPMGRVRNVVV